METGELRTLATLELGPGVVQTLDLAGDLIQVTTYTSKDGGLPPTRYEPLVVDGIDDGCLPLNPGETGADPVCLPNGTRLTVYRPNSDRSAVRWEDGVRHLWVKTEQGQIGEISLADRPLRWAVE